MTHYFIIIFLEKCDKQRRKQDMNKKYTIIAIILIFALTACSQSTPDASISTKTGVLIEATSSSINIQAPDGTTYKFTVDDKTVIQGSENLGDTLEVDYLGEYTSGITATSIKTLSPADTSAVHDDGTPARGPTDNPDAPQPANPPASGEKMMYFTGVVYAFSSSSITVLYEDGNLYTLTIDPNAIIDPGIAVGAKVRVFHTGSLKSGIVTKEINLVEAAAPSTDANFAEEGVTNDKLAQLVENGDIPATTKTLIIWSNDISDITPLKKLTSLTDLAIGDNKISDISPLSSLTNLTQLSIPDNPISDISPLANLTKLTELHIGSEGAVFNDLTPLHDLKNLKTLQLFASITQQELDDLKTALPNCDISAYTIIND